MPFLQSVFDKSAPSQQARWYITDDNIQEEIDRNEGINVSFNFALRWLKQEFDLLKQQQQRYSSKGLLSLIHSGGSDKGQPALVSADQLLAINYFKFLEANGFLGQDHDYLYGELLESTQP